MTEGGRGTQELRGRLAAESLTHSQDRWGWGWGTGRGGLESRNRGEGQRQQERRTPR